MSPSPPQLGKMSQAWQTAYNAGDAAAVTALYTKDAKVMAPGAGSWEAKAADGKHLDHGRYMTFYKKVDGGWKIYRDIWNSSMKQ